MLLDYGGDDITEFLHDTLEEISFPYKGIELNRLYDLHVMDDLKARLCTLSEVQSSEIARHALSDKHPRQTLQPGCTTFSSGRQRSPRRNIYSRHMTRLL